MPKALLILCAFVVVSFVGSATFDTETADARSCKTVNAAGKTAYGINAHNVRCKTTRKKLRRWMRTSFPRNPYGWYCDMRRRPKLCSGGNGAGAPYFTFRLRR
jgi:hypothetical protein